MNDLTRERELLDQAQEALRAVGKAAITVKTTLTQPYPDAPDQSPWSRFMDAPARRAYNLGHEIRQFLKNTSYSVGDDVEWNPTGDTWIAATICAVLDANGVTLDLADGSGQILRVEPRHIRLRRGGVS